MRFDNASTVVYYCLIQMNIINLGILAHIDAGKTSVTENLLFASGATEKCGRVDNGDTITDSMDIEKRRGITVRASTTSIIWNGVKCNIIDTPGHMDFIAEVERTFKMLDGAVLILSAKEGIQAQTKLLFSTLQKLQIPTIIFINKIDRAGVNLERLYMDIKTNLSQDVLFMQTVVDGSVYPVCSQTYIKEEYKEFVCNHDDDILERYLADSEISPADYWNTIIALVAKAKVYPVLHGSAMFNIGINELLDAITSFILPPASVSNRLSSYLYKIEHDLYYIQDDIDFHTYIARCSKNKVVEQIISIIETAVLMFANLTHRRLRQETIITHRAITKSIAEHDPVGARSAMTMHISYNRAAIKEIYDARNRELENQEQ